ncbi:MAG: hypothetical protein ABL919_02215 [Methylococcales bacterium]|nr:hypothetical protein [Methylococcaceae bacterium]
MQILYMILVGLVWFASDVAAAPPTTGAVEVKSNSAVGRKDCQVVPPVEWTDSTIIWDGPCQTGKAHGEGVLRAYKKGADTLLFLGNIEHGELDIGVIDGPEGYIAGQFSHGKLVLEVERNVIIKAFRSASNAAKSYSQRLKQAGNQKSAAFYLKKARKLEQQMD